jgi:hypothetical protein
MENGAHDFEFEALHPDEIADALAEAQADFERFSVLGPAITLNSASLRLLDEIKYPYICYAVPDQTERACKLTAPADLPAEIRDIYLIDPGLTNVYANNASLLLGVQTCVYARFGKSGTATVSGMSAMKFSTTRPGTPTSQHNFGRAFDVKLQGRMKSNGAAYDQLACAYLCLYAVEAGASKLFFSDQTVVDAVNKVTGKAVCQNIAGHENHIHLDGR